MKILLFYNSGAQHFSTKGHFLTS